MAKSYSFYDGTFEEPARMTLKEMRWAMDTYGEEAASGYKELLERVEGAVRMIRDLYGPPANSRMFLRDLLEQLEGEKPC